MKTSWGWSNLRSQRAWIPPVILACLMICLGGWLGSTRVQHEQIAPTINPKSLDFGEPWASEEFEWTLPVTNPTATLIRIREVVKSCSCVGVTPQRFEIPPGQTQSLQLKLNLVDKGAWVSDRIDYRQELTLVSESIPPLTWMFQIRGTVRMPLQLDPEQFRFDVVPTDHTPHAVLIRVAVEVKEVLAHSKHRDVTVECHPSASDPTKWKLMLRLSGSHRGLVDIPLTLTPYTADGEALPRVNWTFTARIRSPIQITPADVDFQTVALDTTVDQVLTLRQTTGRSCDIRDVRCPAGITATIEPTENADVCRLRVQTSYHTRGLHQTALEVDVASGANGELETVRVPIQAYVLDEHVRGTTPAPRKAEEVRE